MKTKLALAVALLCVFSGCIEFEKQTASYRHDTKADTLYIFQNYEGIYGASSEGEGLGSEETIQLKSVMTGERTFLFSNWIFEYSREPLTEMLSRAAGEIEEDKEYEAAIRTLCKLAIDNVKVENVGFYKDAQGRLCGAQRVTIRQWSRLVPALNAMFLKFIAKQGEDANNDEERGAIKRFVAAGESLITLDGNKFTIRVPTSVKDFQDYARSTQGKALIKGGAKLQHLNGVFVIEVGKTDAASVSVTLPFGGGEPFGRRYSGNALSEAGKYGVKESFDAAKAASEFLTPKK